MSTSKLHVLVGTFNVYQQTLNEEVRDWLLSPFKEHPRVLPDIVAIGFQEFSPYPEAFIQRDETRLRYAEQLIEKSLRELCGSQLEQKTSHLGYRKIFVEQVVGLALVIFVKDSLQDQVSDILSNYEGSGPLFIQNKGALGATFRITPKSTGELGGSFCFICAHFTAHEGYAARRNVDFKNLVERLVFPKNCNRVEPTEYCTLHEYEHIFLFGDLNYRANYNFKEVTRLSTSKSIISLIEENDIPSLRKYDELLFEKQEGRTVQGFTEGCHLDFPPTYKFAVGTQEYKWEARIPSWCDRILFFNLDEYNKLSNVSETNEKQEAVSPITTLYYSSYSPSVISDHKPVVGLYEIESRLTPADSVNLNWPSIDPNWRLKRNFGNVLTKVTGVLWYFLGTEKWIPVVLCLAIYKVYKYFEY
ncbi:hypothetical protein K7432_002870 [Basidiobolus ranarum]|uniref:Inositol polyphosphate-related phosphatase domain-containing protein n=1 Tax=Basidiobolus ranarum TaxID=34480 RepID=A0ABR2X0X1_9FUNG